MGELSNVCCQIVLKCWNLARIRRPDIPWSVNKLARSITKWTKACDKRLSRLISYIHHTCEYKQYCQTMQTGLFQDSDSAGDLEDSKYTSSGTWCIFGSHTFVPISWMCKKQTSVSHSSTESEINSLDAGLRLDGIWSLPSSRKHVLEETSSGGPVYISNAKENSMERLMIWTMLILFPQTRILLVRKLCCISLKTTKQWSRWSQREEALQWDMFPEPTELPFLGCSMNGIIFHVLFNSSHVSSINSVKPMSKRTQEDVGEARVTAKSKPMMNLVSRCSVRNPDVFASIASECPGKTRSESQIPLSSRTEQHHRTGRLVFRRLLIKPLRMECWRKNGLLKSGNLMKCWK